MRNTEVRMERNEHILHSVFAIQYSPFNAPHDRGRHARARRGRDRHERVGRAS